MKTIILSLCTLALLGSASSYGQGGGNPPSLTPGAFVTLWRTTTAGETITIPTEGSGYNYNIKWGDSKPNDTGRTGSTTHTYDAAGDYTVTITGDFPRIYFNNTGDKDNILEVKQWGSQVWTSMEKAFFGCSQLQITATDAPSLSPDLSMRAMFAGATAFNSDIGGWDVSQVANMRSVFYGAVNFNADISSWNVSRVESMRGMFYNATAFNADISQWNASNGTNMQHMFYGAAAFNADIGSWNVSKVESMGGMFYNATAFNADISQWNVSNVKDMQFMFYGAAAFNADIGRWNVSRVESMRGMFYNATAFNADISQWNASNGTNMQHMFYGAAAFNADIGRWNVSKVESMRGMFYNATAFNADISQWNVSNVKDMQFMFYGAAAFNADISDWKVFNVENMQAMFYNATKFNADISGWNVSKVKNMQYMFYGATAFSSEHYTRLLIAWAKLTLKPNVKFYIPPVKYCKRAQKARDVLGAQWEFWGDRGSKDCSTPSKSNRHAPVLATIPNQAVEVGKELKVKLVATDADNPKELIYTVDLVAEGQGMRISKEDNGDVFLTWTPATGDRGTNPVTVTVEDDVQNPRQAVQKFTITVKSSTALSVPAAKSTLWVSPIPTTNHLTIRIENTTIGRITLRLCTLLGNVVWERTNQKASEVWEQSMDLSALPKGVYMLEVIADGQRWTRKVVKELGM